MNANSDWIKSILLMGTMTCKVRAEECLLSPTFTTFICIVVISMHEPGNAQHHRLDHSRMTSLDPYAGQRDSVVIVSRLTCILMLLLQQGAHLEHNGQPQRGPKITAPAKPGTSAFSLMTATLLLPCMLPLKLTL